MSSVYNVVSIQERDCFGVYGAGGGEEGKVKIFELHMAQTW
jgi:hypothetical protein